MIELPQIINLNNNNYYLADDIYNCDPNFFIGCSKNKRKMIDKKNLDDTNYAFSYYKDNTWITSDNNYPRAKLLINVLWADSKVPKIIQCKEAIKNIIDDNIVKTKKAIVKNKKKLNDNVIDNAIINNESENDTIKKLQKNIFDKLSDSDFINIDNLYDVAPAPEILNLEDNEKFKDVNGNILNIEVRGERNHKKCYFRVKDVSLAFEMPNLNDVITHKHGAFIYNVHYNYFTIIMATNNHKSNSKKELFLTYNGILKVLFSSRVGSAELFQDWATEKLFTIQMGTIENKEILGANILNINVESFRAVFKSHASKFPCIYLLELGSVKNLKSTFNIPSDVNDNLIIYKYGFTDNMERRLLEHNNDYGKLKNVNINLTTFHIIDIKYTSEAENDLRHFFKNMKKPSNTAAQIALEFTEDCRSKQINPTTAHYYGFVCWCAYRWAEEDMREAYYLLTGKEIK